MHFMTFFTSFTLVFFAHAVEMTIGYDKKLDNAGQSLSNLTCSGGPNGFLPNEFTTIGSLPSYPYVGAAVFIAGWDSPFCASCWAITYTGVTINVLAIDHADDGFDLNLEALNKLTGQAQFIGPIIADVEQVNATLCGI